MVRFTFPFLLWWCMMNTVLSARAAPELLERWRRQVGRQLRQRTTRDTRPLAGISYLARGRIHNGLVDVRHLVFAVVRDLESDNGSLTIRMAGFNGAPVPSGVMFGGAELSRFDKDLALAPRPAARGRRFDLANDELLLVALQLDRHLERHARYPNLPRRSQPRLPQLWAAFPANGSVEVNGDGPELLARCRATGASPAAILRQTCRQFAGLTLYPLEFVSHAWRQFQAVFADLRTIPKRQVLTVDHGAADLRGFVGAVEYDFTQTRFGTAPSRSCSRPR